MCKTCQKPTECQVKSQRWVLANELAIGFYGQKMQEDFIEKMKAEEFGCLVFTKHVQKRMVERAVGESEILSMIINGDPIEYYKNQYGTQKITFWSNIKTGVASYRPLHIIMKNRRGEEQWSVVTVYDPRSEAWRWDSSFTERICFCEKN